MTIEELIEKHVHAYWKTDIEPLDSTRPDQRYRDFAIELLDLVKAEADSLGNALAVKAWNPHKACIDKALDELKKGTP